ACYTSPKVRARDTARLACEHLNVDPEEVTVLGEGFDYRDALELFHAHDADAHVLAVGHEPDFSQIVHDLTGGRVDFKKGGIASRTPAPARGPPPPRSAYPASGG